MKLQQSISMDGKVTTQRTTVDDKNIQAMNGLASNSDSVQVVSSYISKQNNILEDPRISKRQKKEAHTNIRKASKVLDQISTTTNTSAAILSPLPSIGYAQKRNQVAEQQEKRKEADLRGDWDKTTGFDLTTEKFSSIFANVANTTKVKATK